jgi:predicted outer membrane repeat protein
MSNSELRNNTASDPLTPNHPKKGGGVYCQTGANFTSVVFDGNGADKGGGFYVAATAGNTSFNGCNFSNNTASVLGPGGAWTSGNKPTMTNMGGTQPAGDFVEDK